MRLKTNLAYFVIAGTLLGYGGISRGATTPEQLCKPDKLVGLGFSEHLQSEALKQAREQWEASALKQFGQPYKWTDAKDAQEKCQIATCPTTLKKCSMCTISGRPCKPWSVQKVVAMITYQGNLLTAFEDGGIYSSPDGLHAGGGGNTNAVYPGPQRVRAMISYQGPNLSVPPVVITAFEGGSIYSSS